MRLIALLVLLVLLALPGAASATPASPAPDPAGRIQATPVASPVIDPGLKNLPTDVGTLVDDLAREDGFTLTTGMVEVGVLLAVALAVLAGTLWTRRRAAAPR